MESLKAAPSEACAFNATLRCTCKQKCGEESKITCSNCPHKRFIEGFKYSVSKCINCPRSFCTGCDPGYAFDYVLCPPCQLVRIDKWKTISRDPPAPLYVNGHLVRLIPLETWPDIIECPEHAKPKPKSKEQHFFDNYDKLFDC